MKISVITVCLNPGDDFALTAESILAQDHDAVEWVVIDGMSWGQGAALLDRYAPQIDRLIRQPDPGVYHAMREAWRQATGDVIVFLNSGDIFYRADVLRRVVALMPDTADIFYGDHIYVSGGVQHVRRAADFAAIAGRLRHGEIDGAWHSRFPCHQSTFYRRTLFETYTYDTAFQICADHELLLRAYHGGAQVAYGDVIVSRYYGGGLSAQSQTRCSNEWATIYARYCDTPNTVMQRFVGAAAVRSITTLGGVQAMGGHYDVEGPYPQFDNLSLAWATEAGLKLLITETAHDHVLTLRGTVMHPQTLTAALDGVTPLAEASVTPGMFRLPIDLPADLPAGSWVLVTCDNPQPLGATDTRTSGWAILMASLQTKDAAEAEGTGAGSVEIYYAVEDRPADDGRFEGFASGAENKTFRWLMAERGSLALPLNGPVWIERILIDAAFLNQPNFPEVEIAFDLDGEAVGAAPMRSAQRRQLALTLDRRVEPGARLGLTPSHRFRSGADPRELSVGLYGLTVIGRAP